MNVAVLLSERDMTRRVNEHLEVLGCTITGQNEASLVILDDLEQVHPFLSRGKYVIYFIWNDHVLAPDWLPLSANQLIRFRVFEIIPTRILPGLREMRQYIRHLQANLPSYP
ncbi:MAG: hypothetical protein HY566_01860 [Candidatus Kerfeldbacteria bacterium]|nr:hypothetical protein [Candidatus Kerfeldbacteria bacterium]